MTALEAVQAARELLRDVTPLTRDCGKICGAACCRTDEDGQGGMLLFPGEEALYRPLPPGFHWTIDDSVMAGLRLLTCEGVCRRDQRPLACRLFPLLPTRTGARLDRRAWAVCPLMDSGVRGMQTEFADAVKKAGKILYACPEHAAFLDALHAYNERLKQF